MAQISLRVEDEVKKKAEQVCADIGMSLSTAINIYLKKLGKERRIPFEVSVDPFYSQENMSRLREFAAQMDAGDGAIHEVKLDDEKRMILARKKRAFQNMLMMRESSDYPRDFDYKKVMEEAMNEKYNRID